MKDSYAFYTDRLDKEYRVAFEQVEMYVQSQNVDVNTKEERLSELLDIFLSAAETGKPVWKITGNDMEQFCKTVCSDFGVKNRVLFILDFFRRIAKILIFVAVLDLIFPESDIAPDGKLNLWNNFLSLNLSAYFIGIIVSGLFAAIINNILRHIMFRKKRVSMRILKAVSIMAAVVSFAIILAFLFMNMTEPFRCPAWAVLVFSCAYLCIYYLAYGRHVKREKIKFFAMIQEETRKEFPKEMEKKFEKARKKSLKKGKGELTLEAFLDREEKACRFEEKIDAFYYVLPLILTGGSFLFTWKIDGFDGGIDMLIFLAINIVIQYSIVLGIGRIARIGVAERREWIEKKRNETAHEPDFEIAE